MVTGCNPATANYLEQAKEFVDYNTGEIVGNIGNIGNISVAVLRNGVSINGSISKYYLGDNIQTLTRRDTARAIEKLSDALHLAVADAKPVEIEFGTNFLLSNPIPDYLQRLGDMPRLVRNNFTASALYYQHRGKNQPTKFVFYDKIADANEKGVQIPLGMEQANVLRYEMRLSRRLARQTGFADLVADTLSDGRFYRHLLALWGNRYFSIRKITKTEKTNMEQIKTVGDAIDLFVARLMAANPEQAAGFVDELKDARVFSDRKYYTRVKSKLQAIATKTGNPSDDALLRELDDEVKTAMANN